MCMCPCEAAFVRVRTHKLCFCTCAYVHACVCVSVPQYQILLSQLSASLSLVVICLSTSQPSTSPVSLAFFLSFKFFICFPLFPPLIFYFPLPPWYFPASSCLFLSMPSPLSNSTPTPFFLLHYTFNLWLFSPLSLYFLKYFVFFQF